MSVYYNEFDKKAANWLRELIKMGVIANGVVDDRSILEVEPQDLVGFKQHHFFAGIGVWSYALRQAGWADDRPVVTGSPPCQPWSKAGSKKGFKDERHLWPAFFDLIKAINPDVIFGEQVASTEVIGKTNIRGKINELIGEDGCKDGCQDGMSWIDHVQSDLASAHYDLGVLVVPACGVGSPNLRQRTFFVAEKLAGNDGLGGESCGVAHSVSKHLRGEPGQGTGTKSETQGEARQQQWSGLDLGRSCADGSPEPQEVNGYWRDSDWIFCLDNKWRPVEPGSSPLVNGSTASLVSGGDSGLLDPEAINELRISRIKGYGNAINAEVAKAFIESYLEVCAESNNDV